MKDDWPALPERGTQAPEIDRGNGQRFVIRAIAEDHWLINWLHDPTWQSEVRWAPEPNVLGPYSVLTTNGVRTFVGRGEWPEVARVHIA